MQCNIRRNKRSASSCHGLVHSVHGSHLISILGLISKAGRAWRDGGDRGSSADCLIAFAFTFTYTSEIRGR
jgi:hypothetical protein